MRILIMNGPNLGALGVRQPDIYGSRTLDELPKRVRTILGARADEVVLSFFQSNHEGALIDRLEQARTDALPGANGANAADGVVLNAGALTHTSLALADCLAWIGLPCVEVHLSNVLARTDEPLRQKSLLGKHVIGVIAGFGIESYALAVQALLLYTDKGTA